MKITHTGGLYLAHDAPDPAAMQAAGWRWNKIKHAWFSTKINRAAELAPFCVGEAKRRVDEWNAKRAAAIASSHALDSDIDIPAPEGLVYRPYQKAGIAFMLGRKDSLNADAMRLGKTVQSIGVLNALPQLKRVLIIPPATAKINWQREYTAKCLHAKELPADIAYGKVNPKSPVLIVNPDILRNHIDYLRETEWDVIIYDEAHGLKNPDSQRTKFVLGKRSRKVWERSPPLVATRHRLFLTGTPIYTRPIDLWPLCQACDPQGLGANWWNYVNQFCDAREGPFGFDTSGSSNLEELQFIIRSRFMIRREKKDVSKELPPNRQTIVFPKSGLEKLVKKEQNFVQQNLTRFEQMLHAAIDDDLAEQIVNEFAHLDGIDRSEYMGEVAADYVHAAAELATVRQDLALAKCPMVCRFIEEVLESEPKIVVFAHHRSVVGKLREAFPEAAVVIGGMTAPKRQAEIDRFNDDPNCRVFIGNITAAGQAISLAASDVVAFAELSWVPSEMDQAEERVWDVLKERPITIYRLVVEDSLDEQMSRIVDRRQKDIARAMNVSALGVAYGTLDEPTTGK